MITKTTRKTYSPAFKAKVVEEYLLGEHLLSEIASAHQVHPNLILKWKKAAMAALPEALDDQSQKALDRLKDQHEKQVEQVAFHFRQQAGFTAFTGKIISKLAKPPASKLTSLPRIYS